MIPTETEHDKPNFKSRLLERLRDRSRFRACVTGIVLLSGYCLVYVPLNGQIKETGRKLRQAEKTLLLARSIEHLRAQFHKLEGRLPTQTDSKEWAAYVLNGIRKFPLKLTVMDCDAPRTVGPYKAVVLRIELEGGFFDLDGFLCWLESNQRLFRVDSLRISPSRANKDILVMQLTVLGVMG